VRTKEPKPKFCKVCGKEFVPLRSTAVACSYPCAKAWVDARNQKLKEQKAKQEAKIERKLTKERKEKLKTRNDWIKETQVAFNSYIRERDKDQPCICCGKPLGESQNGGGYDAGHYRSTGSAPHLRFHEDNCHAQRKHCNNWKAGNAVNYRLGLINRIGLKRVEQLEADNEPRKWAIDELKELKQKYKDKLKELKSGSKE
jgi:Bacteriophage Lambda NinG protein